MSLGVGTRFCLAKNGVKTLVSHRHVHIGLVVWTDGKSLGLRDYRFIRQSTTLPSNGRRVTTTFSSQILSLSRSLSGQTLPTQQVQNLSFPCVSQLSHVLLQTYLKFAVEIRLTKRSKHQRRCSDVCLGWWRHNEITLQHYDVSWRRHSLIWWYCNHGDDTMDNSSSNTLLPLIHAKL